MAASRIKRSTAAGSDWDASERKPLMTMVVLSLSRVPT